MLAPLLAGISSVRSATAARVPRVVEHAPDRDVDGWLRQAQRHGGQHWVANASTRVEAITIGDHRVPITLLDGSPGRATYVASLHAGWISYPLAELPAHLTRWRRTLTTLAHTAALPLASLLALSGLRRAALVDNHLLSTNLHPMWNATNIGEATTTLCQRFPRRPLALRNVCPAIDERLCDALTTTGWELVPARRIYVVDPRDPAVWRHNHLKRDRKLLHGYDLILVGPHELRDEDLPELRQLFRQLFLDKHCALNPDFTEAFFALCLHQRFLDLFALKLDGRLVGVLGIREQDGWVTTPLIGYDTSLPQNLSIYRRLMALLYEEAERRGCRLHLSSGAGSFKSARGGAPHLEFTAVHTRHLGIVQGTAATSVIGLLRRFAPRILN